MKIINKKESGFTLVELVVVVAVVGVLAVVATPKIVGVAGNARDAQLAGTLGELTKANANNFARRQANGTVGSVVDGCATAISPLAGGVLPVGYVVTSAPAILAWLALDSTPITSAGDAAYGTWVEGDSYNCVIQTTNTPTKIGSYVAIGSSAAL